MPRRSFQEGKEEKERKKSSVASTFNVHTEDTRKKKRKPANLRLKKKKGKEKKNKTLSEKRGKKSKNAKKVRPLIKSLEGGKEKKGRGTDLSYFSSYARKTE